jgi:hypothetical protein|uniref:JmjC domain-containing protein n=1 Tax=viral metagenome TaxID=1070528 RepID=A0A6C0CL78_9ZZZZ
MKSIISILIFCIVLFIYLHINFHLRTSNDLEVYEIDQPSKEKLEEICDLRQPVIFDYSVDGLLNECNIDTIEKNYGAFDIKVRNVKEYDDIAELYLPLTLNTGRDIFRKDNDERYISENNQDFLEETSLIKHMRYNDNFLRPLSVSNCIYDIMFSSNNSKTVLKYELNYRNYFLVTQGSVKIKLIPPKSSKYLYSIKDYDNFEFLSPVNPWDVQNQFKADFDKLKTLEVTLNKGQIIFIPAYWWYSIWFEDNTSLASFKYKTYMNNIAISNHLLVNILQNQNVKREIAKKKNISEDSNKNEEKEHSEEKI